VFVKPTPSVCLVACLALLCLLSLLHLDGSTADGQIAQARLHSVASTCASAWLEALPAARSLTFSDSGLRAALRRRLRLPTLQPGPRIRLPRVKARGVRRVYTGIVILYRYSVYRYNNTGILRKNWHLRYILAIFYIAGTV
jgi:hypothetical protein